MAGMRLASHRISSRLLALTLLAATLSACDNGPLLRDAYMGQKFLEPGLLPQRAKHDINGNAIIAAKPPVEPTAKQTAKE